MSLIILVKFVIQKNPIFLRQGIMDNVFNEAFIKEDIILLPKINSVLVGSPEEKRLINSENFLDF